MKIAIIGAGFIGRQHIEAIRRIPGAEVTAIVDKNALAVGETARMLNIPKYYSDVKELLSDKEITVVHNCTPNAFHYAINREVIMAGKHIYSEKPLTFFSNQAKELNELAVKAGVAAGVNFNYRHNVMVRELRERVKREMRVFCVRCSYLQDWMMYETDYDWRAEPEMGGPSRAIADIGSHCFDIAQFVMGKRISSVYAHLMNFYPVRKKTTERKTFEAGEIVGTIEVKSEDAAFILAKFEDGTPAMFDISQVWAGKKNGLSIELAASDSSYRWDQEKMDRLWIGKRNQANEELIADPKLLSDAARAFTTLPGGHSVGWADALRNGIAVFYDAIEEQTYQAGYHEYTDFASAASIIELVEACLLSDRESRWVDII